MTWFFVALSAYFLLAITNLVDKFLVEKVVGSARAYTFLPCDGCIFFGHHGFYLGREHFSGYLF